MSFNGSGTYVLAAGNPVTTGTTISSTWANNTLNDIANNGLSYCLTKDGQTVPTANLPMGGYKLTGMGNASASGNALNYGQASWSLAAGTLTGALTATSATLSSTLAVTGATTLSNYLTTAGIVSATRTTVASVAGTVDLTANAANTDDIAISGTNTITAFTVAAGRVIRVTATGAFTLTNNSAIVTQTGANITVTAGDTFSLRATAADTVEMLFYSKTVPFTPSKTNALAGSIIDTKYTQSQATVVGAGTSIPYDNTIPQITEGDLFLTAPAITPSNASNILRITVQFAGTENTNTSTYMTVALFQDSTANAIAAAVKDCASAAGNVPNPTMLVYYMVAGTTSATTFTVRAGLDTANPVVMNGFNSASVCGGKATSTITVEEIKV